MNVRYASRVSAFHIDCLYLDFDGKHYRPVQVEFNISAFAGPRSITRLQVYPIRFLEPSRKNTCEKELLDRGKTFHDLALPDASHWEYQGMTLGPEDKEEVR